MRSIAESVIANTRVTNSLRPSRLTAMPPANVSPVATGSVNVRDGVITPSAKTNSRTVFCAAPEE